MSSIFFPNKIKYFLDLIRFNKPVGFILLMWPCWFAMAILPMNTLNHLKWFFYFFAGSFLMRSVGCIINDLIDIKIDKKIKRTSQRPLVNKNITKTEAVLFIILLSILSLLVLLQFNFKAIIVGLSAFPLIILYPYMKRITYWPQLFLGIIFNWGILIVAVQFIGFFSLNMLILYLGCIFWTLGYDTIYAYQDRDDDIKNKIKSTAVLFGNKGKYFVIIFYLIFGFILGCLGFQDSNSITSIFVLIPLLIALIFFLNKWDLYSISSSNFYFKINNVFGLLCFIYLIIY